MKGIRVISERFLMSSSLSHYLIVLSACVTLPLFAKMDIEISGHKKTVDRYLYRLVEKCLNQSESQDSTASLYSSVQQCILNSKLFSEVNLKQSDNVLKIDVRERVSLIPIPFAQAGSAGQLSYGFLLLESNFLGLGKTVAAGALFSNRGHSVFGHYKDPSILFSKWTLTGTIVNNEQEILVFGPDDKDGYDHVDQAVYGLIRQEKRGVFQVGYEVLEHTHAEVLSGIHDRRFRPFKQFIQPDNYRTQSLGLGLKYQNENFKFYFNEGGSVSLSFMQQTDRTDGVQKSSVYQGSTYFGISAVRDHALKVSLFGGLKIKGSIADAILIGHRPGFRGIPTVGAWVDRYLSVASEYLVPIRAYSTGTWVVGALWDQGRLWSPLPLDHPKIDYWAAGLGIYYFLKTIAIPGVGLEIGHNNRYQEIFASLTLGLSLN